MSGPSLRRATPQVISDSYFLPSSPPGSLHPYTHDLMQDTVTLGNNLRQHVVCALYGTLGYYVAIQNVLVQQKKWENRKPANQSSSHIRIAAPAKTESTVPEVHTPSPSQGFALPSAGNALLPTPVHGWPRFII